MHPTGPNSCLVNYVILVHHASLTIPQEASSSFSVLAAIMMGMQTIIAVRFF